MAFVHPKDRGRPLATTDRAGIAQFSSSNFSVSEGVVSLSGSALTTFAALTDTNITTPTSGQIPIYDGTNSWDNKSVSGDITLSNAGVAAIASGVIINTDVKSDAAIAFSKLAALTTGSVLVGAANVAAALDGKGDGKVLVGNGTTMTSVAISGDVTLANTGATTVTDLTITSEAQGDVLYFNGTNWVRLAAGTAGQSLVTAGAASNPYWGTPSSGSSDTLLSPFTVEGGTYDPATTVTTQTTSAAALTIPDLGGVAQEWCFTKQAQTLENKTLTAPIIATGGKIVDAGGDEYIVFTEDTTPVTYIGITSGDTGVAPIVSGAGETNTHLMLKGTGTGNVQIADGGDITAIVQFELDGATTGKTMTLTHSHTDDRTITFPDATDTLVGKATTDTLTNKTLTTPIIATTGYIADAGGDEYLQFIESTTPVNHIVVTQGDTGVSPMITSGGEANIPLMLHGNGTGNVQITDGGDITAKMEFELDGATTGKTMTIVSSQDGDYSLTLPNATDTLVGKATTDTLTNKTIDCAGTGNVITNVDIEELQAETIPAADGNSVTIVDGLIMAKVTNNATNFTIYNANAPYAFMVIDAWSVNISGDGGTWKLNDGNAGGGTDITDVVTVAASDTDIDRITTLDDAAAQIAASGSLSVVFDGGGALDAYIFIRIARLA